MSKVISSSVAAQTGKLSNNTILGALQRRHNSTFILRRKFAIQLFGVATFSWLFIFEYIQLLDLGL
jgi:hypothetical protein